ncbi:monovalent cation/H+ antiporter subunit D [Shimia sp. MMG029]|uniref:monovalent cation/H+ antiporter subunit D n=1 Tax=Shimia sp. MMG029 TaxID=3021978 RepID=UPI0022FED287|nr:monovalent cation/H+ antiporter subunit D [Shimia sp. MMG029]MDA5558449.1 monovalent cation/H+ antiporter subunit D [Shimia sp. MMG029]
MNHWIIAPVILPALLAPIIAFVMRHDIVLARAASALGAVALAAIAVGLTILAMDGSTHVYYLGDWPAPFGIVLVLDRLSAMMVLLTSILALVVLWHMMATGRDQRGRHFHALFQFQLMGVCGAFLTGDAFNLFVFFEVLLIASYGLMIHGGGRVRMRAGLQYVVMNLAGSTLFLFALGALYAATGTLNMADLAEKVRAIPMEDAALVRVAAVLLLMVFAIKAALVPVHFWLPGTYSNAPAPVAALFAIMTKVGAYAIIRVYTLIFGPDVVATDGLITTLLVPAATLTLAVGAFGALAAKRFMPMLSFAVIGSMGTLTFAISGMTPEAMSAALYYMVHSTFAAAALFLLADLVTRRRGNDALTPQMETEKHGIFSALFFAGAIAMTGMPPLSGFFGKLLVLDAVRDTAWMTVAWVAILVGSLITIVGFARAGSILFWKARRNPNGDPDAQWVARSDRSPLNAQKLTSIFTMLFMMAMLVAAARPISVYMDAAAAQIFDVTSYIEAVLRPAGEVLK